MNCVLRTPCKWGQDCFSAPSCSRCNRVSAPPCTPCNHSLDPSVHLTYCPTVMPSTQSEQRHSILRSSGREVQTSIIICALKRLLQWNMAAKKIGTYAFIAFLCHLAYLCTSEKPMLVDSQVNTVTPACNESWKRWRAVLNIPWNGPKSSKEMSLSSFIAFCLRWCIRQYSSVAELLCCVCSPPCSWADTWELFSCGAHTRASHENRGIVFSRQRTLFFRRSMLAWPAVSGSFSSHYSTLLLRRTCSCMRSGKWNYSGDADTHTIYLGRADTQHESKHQEASTPVLM